MNTKLLVALLATSTVWFTTAPRAAAYFPNPDAAAEPLPAPPAAPAQPEPPELDVPGAAQAPVTVALAAANLGREIQVKVLADATAAAERATAAAENAAQAVQKRVQAIVHGAPHAMSGGNGFGSFFRTALGGSATEKPLVVSSSPIEPAILAEIEEDINVMARLLEGSVEDAREDRAARRASGIIVNVLPGLDGTPRNLFVEGHGAIFQIAVRFPLAPGTKKETREEAKPAKNSAWESARRELYGGESEEVFELPGKGEPPAYDADKVEALKKSVLKALAHAHNFRHLKPDESVTVAVRYGGETRKRIYVTEVHGAEAPVRSESRVEKSASPATTMTIRVKKAAAEALAAGTLDEEGFRKRATIAIY